LNHGIGIKLGLDLNVVLGTVLLDMYVKSDCLRDWIEWEEEIGEAWFGLSDIWELQREEEDMGKNVNSHTDWTDWGQNGFFMYG